MRVRWDDHESPASIRVAQSGQAAQTPLTAAGTPAQSNRQTDGIRDPRMSSETGTNGSTRRLPLTDDQRAEVKRLVDAGDEPGAIELLRSIRRQGVLDDLIVEVFGSREAYEARQDLRTIHGLRELLASAAPPQAEQSLKTTLIIHSPVRPHREPEAS